MAGLTLTLETAKQTLLNTQVQIQTASNNISNAENTGYARQKVVLGSNADLFSTNGYIGTGASITAIMQERDQFVEQRLRNTNSDESKYSTLSSQLTEVQAAMADNGTTGVSGALGDFYDAWDKLSQNPSGPAEQTEVYSAASNLADTIQATYSRLNDLDTQLPTQIQDAVDQANTLIDKIADYNTAIRESETPGSTSTANSLRDARYQAMSDLSQLIPVKFTEDSSGNVTITTDTTSAGAVTIVSNGTATHIATTTDVTSGSLAGLNAAKTDVENYMGRLDTFAATLVSQSNTLHGAGTNPALAVFDPSGTTASTITASTTFLKAGQTVAEEAGYATALAGLQSTQLTFSDGKTATLAGYMSDVQKQVGVDAQQAASNQSFNQTLQTQLKTQQQSTSGVSLDEEMVNMIQYQQVYQAAAHIIDKTSQLLDAVITMT